VTETIKEVPAGAAPYSKFFLRFYDWNLLQFNCRFVWKCSPDHMLALYNEHVSANHLDVGVGTGYFLDHCRFPVAHPRLALMDLNSNSLEMTARRVRRYKPEVYQWNALEPFQTDMERFDSVGMMNLLHCLPGTMQTKAIVFEHLKGLLNPDGVLFGSSILGNGVPHNSMARLALKCANSRGWMTNYQDDPDGLKRSLEEHFSESSLKIVGSIALFSARK